MPIYMKIEGIQSEFERGLQIESFSWGATNSATHGAGGGGGAGKVQMQDFHFVMKSNSASPSLFRACATGKHFQKADFFFDIVNPNGEEEHFYRVIMSDVMVSSFQSGGSEGGESRPMEQVSINYQKIDFAVVGDKR